LTTEQAVRLDGESDGTRSYIEFSDGGEVVTNGGNWTLMASGRLDPAANGQATYNLLAVDNETVTLAYSNGGWEATYLKGNESAQARVSATEPTTYTSLGVRYDNSTEELTLTRNGNVSNRTTLDTTSETRPLQQDWFGAVDEYRFFDVALADSELDRLAAEPVAGTTVNTTARYRLDEGSGNTSAADYSSGTATLVSGTWTTGLANPIEEDVDYDVTFDPLAVTTFADGLADGAPIVYVNWDSGLDAEVATIVSGFSSAVSLIPILLIALLAGVLITTTARLRQ